MTVQTTIGPSGIPYIRTPYCTFGCGRQAPSDETQHSPACDRANVGAEGQAEYDHFYEMVEPQPNPINLDLLRAVQASAYTGEPLADSAIRTLAEFALQGECGICYHGLHREMCTVDTYLDGAPCGCP